MKRLALQGPEWTRLDGCCVVTPYNLSSGDLASSRSRVDSGLEKVGKSLGDSSRGFEGVTCVKA